MRLVQGANGLTLRELRRLDLDPIAEAAWQQQRGRLVATLDEAGVDPTERLEALREHDLHRDADTPIRLWLLSRKGCREIIKAACSLAEPKIDAAVFTEGLHEPDLQRIAFELTAIMRPKPEEKPLGESVAGVQGPGQSA